MGYSIHIQELTCKSNDKRVTVSFSYEEIRDIANGLYIVSQTDNRYSDISGKCKFLLDLVKHGNIQPETIKRLKEKTSE